MTKRPIDRILSMCDLQRTADYFGNYYFSPDTMRFFSSRVSETLYRVNDSMGYFVTSESGPSGIRRYSVSYYIVTENEKTGNDTLEIDRASEFQEFASSDGAHEYAKRLQGYAMLDINSFELTR